MEKENEGSRPSRLAGNQALLEVRKRGERKSQQLNPEWSKIRWSFEEKSVACHAYLIGYKFILKGAQNCFISNYVCKMNMMHISRIHFMKKGTQNRLISSYFQIFSKTDEERKRT